MHLESNKSAEQTAKLDSRDVTCPICMCIADDPQISSCCERIFCKKDADPSRYDNGCPLCRQKKFSFQPSVKHKEMLDKLTMKCDCSERIAFDEIENHLERCASVTSTCPHKTCQEKGLTIKYNTQQLINHLARAHCDEVPFLGSTYVHKKSVESYKKTSAKYDDLVSTLYSVLYPKMIEIQMKNAADKQEQSTAFTCPRGHKLIEADHTQRKRKNGAAYSSLGFNCDICHHSFSNGPSWHCSCTDSGFDKCMSCFACELYDIDDETLKLANRDKEKQQQQRYHREAIRTLARLPHGVFRLLSRTIGNNDHDEDDDDNDDDDDDDNDDEDDLDLLALRHQSPYLLERYRSERTDTEQSNANLRED